MKIFGVDKRIMWSEDLYLRKASRDLTEEEVKSSHFKELVNFMFEALYENDIGVGLAAPQIGLMIKLVVIDIKRNGKSPLVLINPSFEPISNEMTDSKETCLSFESVCGVVQRYRKVKVSARDVNFEEIEFIAENFLACVCQHEIDHLNGNVYIDKTEVSDSQKYEILLAQKALETIYNSWLNEVVN